MSLEVSTACIFQTSTLCLLIPCDIQARDAVDPLSALRFWTDAAEGRREVQNYITRFASRSRRQLRSDIVGDDVSTIASGTTVTSSNNEFKPSLPPIMDMVGNSNEKRGGMGMHANTSQETLSPPPSYRSTPPSVIMTPTTSTSAQSQRQPQTQTRRTGGRRSFFFKRVLGGMAGGDGGFGGGGGGGGGGC